MARELQIRITADNTDAKAKLGQTEKALSGVTTSAEKASKQTTALGKDSSSAARDVGTLGVASKALGVSLSTIGIGTVVTGLAALGREAFVLSGRLSDVSAATGLSKRFLQELEFAGGQVNVQMEDVARAVQNLQTQVIQRSPAVVKALQGINIPIAEAARLNPDDLFRRIAVAINDIENPAERTAAAVALFGRAGKDLVPLLADFSNLTDGAVIMSDRTVESFDGMGDAVSRWTSRLTSAVGESVSSLFTLRGLMEGFDRMTGGTGKSQEFFLSSDVNAQLDATASRMATLRDRTREMPPALADARAASEEFAKSNAESEAKIRANIAAWERQNAEIQAFSDVLTGKKLAKEVDTLARSVELAGREGGISAHQYKELGKRLEEMRQQGAVLPRQLDDIRHAHTRAEFATKVHTLAARDLQDTFRDYRSATLVAKVTISEMTEEINAKISKTRLNLDDLGRTITELPAPPPRHFEAWRAGVAQTFEGFKQDLGGVIHSMVGGWSSAWDAMKQMGMNVFHSLLQAAIDQFLNPLLNSWSKTVAQMAGGSAASGGAASVGAGGAGAGVGAAATLLPWLSVAPIAIPWAGALFGEHVMDPGVYQALLDEQHANQTDYSGNIPAMASGGIVPATPGGRLVRVGEAGMAEAIVPLDKWSGGGQPVINIDARGAYFRTREDIRELAHDIIKALPNAARTYGADRAPA